MSVKGLIQKLQQQVHRLRTSVHRSRPGRLRVMNLEDRRLLDATAGFLAGQLILDGFDAGESIQVTEDVSGQLNFTLSNGTFEAPVDSGLGLANSNQTLTLDPGSLASLNINQSDADLASITLDASLTLNDLLIQNGGNVEVSDLTVNADSFINATSISDAAGSDLRITGHAEFQAGTITLGDNTSDIVNFGTLTFVSSGDVTINEDSATQINGTNSAGTLTLVSAQAITNDSGSILDVSANASLNAASIELDQAGASSVNFGSLSFTSVGNVTIQESSDLQISADSSGATVSLSANGNIQSTGSSTLSSTELSLTASETATSEGAIGSLGADFQFSTDQLSTSSAADQHLATDSATNFSSLSAVDSSTLFDTDSTATIFLNDGDFTGTGITGGLTVADDVQLATDGTIEDAVFAAGSEITFRIESTPASGGAIVTDFDQWQVSGSVDLGGATLAIADQNLVGHGTTILLINNNGTATTGTFAGLTEGSTVTGTSGQEYQISYAGGDGNDVQLTALTSTFAFDLTSDSVVENVSGGAATVTVNRSGDISTADSVTVSVSSGSANLGTDFSSTSAYTASFAAGQSSATISIDITDDGIVETAETLNLELVNPTSGFLDATARSSVLTILNDDPGVLVRLASGQLTVSDESPTGQDNTFSISIDNATNELVISSDQQNLGTGSVVLFDELRFDVALITQQIIVEGNGGNDVLTVDFTNGNPIVGTGIRFDGGAQSGGLGDGLAVIGDGILNATYTPDAVNFGDGEVNVSGSLIQFTGLEPVDISGFATATLNLPGANDVLTIQEGTDFFAGGTQDALLVSGTSDGVAIETAAFRNNTNLVINTVAGGVDGTDLITIDSAANGHSNTNISIDTGSTVGDEIRINMAVTATGNLNFAATTITLNSSSVTAGGSQVFTGAVVAEQNVSLSGTSVEITGSLDSAAGGSPSVSILGNAIINGNVGATNSLAALGITGTTTLDGNVTTSGHQTYQGALNLVDDAILTATGSGEIQFQDTVDGNQFLTINAANDAVQFAAAVGSSTVLSGLEITSGSAVFDSSIQVDDQGLAVETTGTATFAGNVTSTNNGTIRLSTAAGGLVATNVVGSGQVVLDADVGDVEVVNVVSTNSDIRVTADAGNIQLQNAVANSAGAEISLTASEDILDATAGALGAGAHLSAVNGTVRVVAENIGSAGTNIFQPTPDSPIRIDANRVNLTATGTVLNGNIAVDLLSASVIDTLSGNHVFVDSVGDVTLAAPPIANSLSIMTTADIDIQSPITVVDDLRLESREITDFSGATADLNATRILLNSQTIADVSVTAEQIDATTNGALTISSDSTLLQLTDLDGDLSAINTNGNTAILNQTTGGRIVQQLPADLNQNSRILSDQLLLSGLGAFELTNSTNNITTLAANNNGQITFADTDSIVVGSVAGTTGLTTTGNDLFVTAGESIDLQQQVNVANADARFVVGTGTLTGNISQANSGQIVADELGIRNDAATGDVVLAALNDVNTFAGANSANGGAIVFQDVDEFTIGTVQEDVVSNVVFAETTGLTSNDGDITIATGVAAAGTNSLLINSAVVAGDGTVRLQVDGNLNQSAAGTIQANQLAVRQVGAAGNVILDAGNSVRQLAIDNEAVGGTIGFQNQQSLTVESVTGVTFSAAPNASALAFDPTSGLNTNNGVIQINADGPVVGDGEIQLNAEVNAGTAQVALSADGRVSQTATAAITAESLLVRQQAEIVSANVELGAASNDVSTLAIRNVSEGGNISFHDVTNLTVTSVTVADVGNLSTASFAGIDSDAGDINVTSTGNLIVNQNINAASDTSTTAIDETITLISRSGNFTLADGTVISTDEDPIAGNFVDATGDRIDILAGTDGTNGIVDLGDPATIELRTDGGVARQIAPRPSGFTSAPTTGAETAFVTLTDAANSRSNLTATENGLLGQLDFVFGVAGEENLEVVFDFGVITIIDPTTNGVAGPAVQQASGIFVFDESDRDKSIFIISEGGERYRIEHLFTSSDLVTTTNDRNGREQNPNIIGVRFSVAQHESINVFGTGAVDPTSPTTVSTAGAFTGVTSAVTDASGVAISPTAAGLSLLTSTDTNGLRNLQAEASSAFPLQNVVDTPTGRPIGLAEFEFIAGPPPGLVRFEPSERFVADPPKVAAPIDALAISRIAGDAFFGEAGASDAGVGTDVYLQIRRYFELDAEAEVVIARINDSDLITSRQAFEEFVAENSELQDGAGYEIWLVTETGGQQVERPVVQFEITGGRPGPASESFFETDQPAELFDLEFQQAEDFGQDSDSRQESNSNPNVQQNGTHQDPTNEQNGDEQPEPLSHSSSRRSDGKELGQGILLGESSLPSSFHRNSIEFDQTQQFETNFVTSSHAHLLTSHDQASITTDRDAFDDHATEGLDSGVSESAAVTGFAASAYGAVSRYRSRSRRRPIQSNHSLTSRTMQNLRHRSDFCQTPPIEGQ